MEDRHLARLAELAQQGLVEQAEDVLYEMIDDGKDARTVHYNALIDSCAPVKDSERAERWLFRMQALDVVPDIGTYNSLIHVAAASRSAQTAKQWFEEAQAAGLTVGVETYQAILHALRQAGEVSSVEAWIERMMDAGLRPDISCCNSVIGAFADSRQIRKVEEWLAVTEHNLRIPLNVDSYNLAIGAYVAADGVGTAEQLMQQMIDRGLQPNAESYVLLTGDGKSYRELSVVKRWSQRLLEADVELSAPAYTAIIGAFTAAGDAKRAEGWYSRMVDDGKQTAEALALVVDALVLSSGAEGMETAQEWVDQCRQAGLPLSPAVYAALASADVLRGDFEQVEARMQQMEADGLEMDEASLTALLLAYANAKPQQSQLAEQMFKQQMLRGRLEATRDVLQALRAAVGGARCLSLRRELQLGSSLLEAVNITGTKKGKGLGFKPNRVWSSLAPGPSAPEKVLSWE